MSERLNDHIQLLYRVQERLSNAQPQAGGLISDEILHQLAQVIDLLQEHSDSAYARGGDWLVHIFTHVPQLTPAIDRDLLWFFGGECLHFLTDEEISLFQQLDELEEENRQRGAVFDRQVAKQLLQSGGSGFNA